MQDSDQSLPPHVQLIQMATAHWVSHIVFAAAKFDIADHLAAGPKTAEELAKITATHAPALYRVMRTLASLGILNEDGSRRFSLTPMGEALRSVAPGCARACILTLANEEWVRGVAQLPYSIQTGQSGFEKIMGMPIFDWLAKHPEQASLFSETMVGIHGAEPPAVAAAYDFSDCKTIVDVGGATGNLLCAILEKYPNAQGLLYDLPHVVRDAPAMIGKRRLTERTRIESGSFFDRIPSGGDAYLLSHIIHDWPEEQCLTILANCRKAMGANSRLLLVEMVLPPGNTPHPG